MSMCICEGTGLREERSNYVICGACPEGRRLLGVLVNIARREPVATSNVGDRAFFTSPCVYLEPMREAEKYVDADGFYGPKREK